MNAMERFKESFFRGRLVWVRGAAKGGGVRMAQRMLRNCGVCDSRIAVMDALTLVRVFRTGFPWKFLSQERVLILRAFETLTSAERSTFLAVLEKSRSIRLAWGVRFILVSDSAADAADFFPPDFSPEPSPVRVRGALPEPDLDLRIHALIADAARATGKEIRRVSEETAFLLEHLPAESGENAWSEWILEAVRNSCDGVLQIENFCTA